MSGRKGKRSRQGDAVARRVRKDNAAGKRLRDIGTGSAGGSGGGVGVGSGGVGVGSSGVGSGVGSGVDSGVGSGGVGGSGGGSVGSSGGVDWSLLWGSEETPRALTAREAFAPARTLGGSEKTRLAQDAALESAGVYTLIEHAMELGQWPEAGFMGYAALQRASQNGLLRACVETVADDMTRRWISLVERDASQPGDKEAFLAEMRRLGLRDLFHDACCAVGYEGGCLIFLDVGARGDALADPLDKSGRGAELRLGSPLRLTLVDPVDCSPGDYNAADPLAADYFRPSWWMIRGRRVHASRVIRVTADEPLLLLRPAYNFFGIPQAQVLWDYVLHFQKNRDAANRLLNRFSLTALKTDMEATLRAAGGLRQLDARMKVLARFRNNDGVLALDKESEDLAQINTPLSGVRDLVQQSLELLAALNRTPAVKLLGISPSGFNATGESDIRNYYDHISSRQEKTLRGPLEQTFRALAIRLFGQPDRAPLFDFAPLSDADEAALAAARKQRASSLAELVSAGILSPAEARRCLRDTPDSDFDFLE